VPLAVQIRYAGASRTSAPRPILPGMDGAIWGFIGVVIGGLITIAAEWIRGHSASGLDSAKRADDRRLSRDAFQRENLLRLQERLAEWMRAEARAMMFDQQAFKSTRGLTLLPAEIDAEAFETGRQLGYCAERVKDDDLRAAVSALTAHAAAIQAGRAVYHETVTAASLDAEDAELGYQYVDVQNLLGRKLRGYL
jgi:hypothetical protein